VLLSDRAATSRAPPAPPRPGSARGRRRRPLDPRPASPGRDGDEINPAAVSLPRDGDAVTAIQGTRDARLASRRTSHSPPRARERPAGRQGAISVVDRDHPRACSRRTGNAVSAAPSRPPVHDSPPPAADRPPRPLNPPAPETPPPNRGASGSPISLDQSPARQAARRGVRRKGGALRGKRVAQGGSPLRRRHVCAPSPPRSAAKPRPAGVAPEGGALRGKPSGAGGSPLRRRTWCAAVRRAQARQDPRRGSRRKGVRCEAKPMAQGEAPPSAATCVPPSPPREARLKTAPTSIAPHTAVRSRNAVPPEVIQPLSSPVTAARWRRWRLVQHRIGDAASTTQPDHRVSG